eukprot:1186383-Prorocentrum_minimum.AAC.1
MQCIIPDGCVILPAKQRFLTNKYIPGNDNILSPYFTKRGHMYLSTSDAEVTDFDIKAYIMSRPKQAVPEAAVVLFAEGNILRLDLTGRISRTNTEISSSPSTRNELLNASPSCRSCRRSLAKRKRQLPEHGLRFAFIFPSTNPMEVAHATSTQVRHLLMPEGDSAWPGGEGGDRAPYYPKT